MITQLENREITIEPILVIADDNLVVLNLHEKQCNTLDRPGRKHFKIFSKCEK